MITEALGIAKVAGLRVASGGLALWLAPLGKALLVAGVAIGGYLYWESSKVEQGRAEERAISLQLTREAELRALKERTAIEAKRAELQAKDEAAAKSIGETEEKVRNDNAGDGVLWAPDDGWLRSKRARGAGKR